MQLAERLAELKKQIPASARLVAVSKYVTAHEIREAYALGLRDFAESKVQEAARKKNELADLNDLNWHLVGHLQTNKIKLALQTFDWIHSGDRLELLQKLDRQAAELGKLPKVLLQVKLASDPSKSGFVPSELLEQLPTIDRLSNLQIVGLMTILPKASTSAESTELFFRLAELKKQIAERSLSGIRMQELSMGMSGDYLQAIKAGSTMLRIGRALFC